MSPSPVEFKLLISKVTTNAADTWTLWGKNTIFPLKYTESRSIQYVESNTKCNFVKYKYVKTVSTVLLLLLLLSCGFPETLVYVIVHPILWLSCQSDAALIQVGVNLSSPRLDAEVEVNFITIWLMESNKRRRGIKMEQCRRSVSISAPDHCRQRLMDLPLRRWPRRELGSDLVIVHLNVKTSRLKSSPGGLQIFGSILWPLYCYYNTCVCL